MAAIGAPDRRRIQLAEMVGEGIMVGPPTLLLTRPSLWEGEPWIVDLLTPSVEESEHRFSGDARLLAGEASLEEAALLLGGGFIVAWEGQERCRLVRHPHLRERVSRAPFWVVPPLPAEGLAPSPPGDLLLWGGGAWDWLDSSTFSRALSLHRWAGGSLRGVVLADRYPGAWRSTPGAEKGCEGMTVRRATPHKTLLEDASRAGAWISLHWRESPEAGAAFRTRLLDAGACAKPVIATPGEWLGDLIVSGGGGWHTPAEDPEALGRLLGGLEKGTLAERGGVAKAIVEGLLREEIPASPSLIDPGGGAGLRDAVEKAWRGFSHPIWRLKTKWEGRR